MQCTLSIPVAKEKWWLVACKLLSASATLGGAGASALAELGHVAATHRQARVRVRCSRQFPHSLTRSSEAQVVLMSLDTPCEGHRQGGGGGVLQQTQQTQCTPVAENSELPRYEGTLQERKEEQGIRRGLQRQPGG